MPALIIIVATFLLCFLIDKGFGKLFRSRPQHKSGKAVRLGKFYSLGGLILSLLGVMALVTGLSESLLLTVGGVVVLATGIFFFFFYLSFGVFYDDESFIAASFGKRSRSYRYGDIRCQQLYNNRGQVLVELYFSDGKSLQLQSSMTKMYAFMDTAFAGWCAQRGVKKEDCPFHDPEKCCWFPPMEE